MPDKQNFNIEGDVSGGNVNIGGTQIYYGSVYSDLYGQLT